MGPHLWCVGDSPIRTNNTSEGKVNLILRTKILMNASAHSHFQHITEDLLQECYTNILMYGNLYIH
jgi:hypothetical protein